MNKLFYTANMKDLNKLLLLQLIRGGAIKNIYRKWWNPKGWIFGKECIKYIPPEKLYKAE